MAGGSENQLIKFKDQIKLLVLKELMAIDDSPITAINKAKFVRLQVAKQDDDSLVLNDDEVVKLATQSAQVNPANIYEPESSLLRNPGDMYSTIHGIDDVIISHERIIKRTRELIVSTKQYDENQLSQLNMWNYIMFASVHWYVTDLSMQLAYSFGVEAGMDFADIVTDYQKIAHEFSDLVVNSYILPKVCAIQNGTQAEQIAAFSKAADVFSSCQSQLSTGRVPEAFQPLVYNLVDETAKGLSGHFDANRYLNVVNSLPLEHTAFRIIVGAALAFAGLMLAAVAITLAVHSFGVSTPLSALGVVVGVDMMLAGFAMAAAAITLGMAGTATFFAKSKAPTEFAQQNPEGVKAITVAAEEFHVHQTARMGG